MTENETKIKPCVVLLEQCTPKAQLALSAELRNVINERNILTTKTRKKFLYALDEITDRDVDDRKKTHKNQVLQEILDSEVTYLKQLEVIMNYFVAPLREQKILSQEDLQVIFGKIETIYQINGALLNELKEDLTNVAQAFLKLAPFFKLYSVYAYDYNLSINRLQKLHVDNPLFSKFLESQETRPEVQSKLSALLIAPIQRVPRYCLLLQQVLENTSYSDSDYQILLTTVKKLEQAAKHINNLVGERENAQRLLELQRSLHKSKPPIIKPGRILLKEGELVKFSETGDQDTKQYFVLLSDILVCCKIKKEQIDSPNSLKCLLILPLNKCKIKYYNSTKMIKIICENEHLYVYHKSAEESEKWYGCLDDAIEKYVKNRQTLKKESTLRRPANRKYFENYSDAGISPNKLRRKRRLDETQPINDFESVYKSSDGSDSDEDQTCFPIYNIKKRPKINPHSSKTTDSQFESIYTRDSLFPLRHHRGNPAPSCAKAKTQVEFDETEVATENQNVFVFGREDNSPASYSRIGNFFSSVGKGFKRLFGFKQ